MLRDVVKSAPPSSGGVCVSAAVALPSVCASEADLHRVRRRGDRRREHEGARRSSVSEASSLSSCRGTSLSRELTHARMRALETEQDPDKRADRRADTGRLSRGRFVLREEMSHMRAGRTWPLAAALLVVLALAAPAAAHDNGLGSSWLTRGPSRAGTGRARRARPANFEMVGSVERTRYDSTYRNSDLAFWGRLALRRSLRRLPDRRRRRPAQAGAARRLRLPGLAARRLGLGRPAVRLGRDAAHEPGLRLHRPAAARRASRASASSTSPTRPAGPDQGRADRLRLAHPHAGARSAPRPRAALRRLVHGVGARAVELRQRVQAPRRERAAAHHKISVVEVPLANPAAANVVSEPRFPQKDRTGGPASTAATTSRCSWSSSGPARPAWARARSGTSPTSSTRRRSGRVFNPNVEFFHSATFS